MKGARRAFTLIEVLVAMVVLSLISTGLLATTWRLVGIARNYVDHTIASSYCHDVIYTATASENKFGCAWKKNMTISWRINPEDELHELPRIETVDIFNRSTVVYPLWRKQDKNHYPMCTITYPTETTIKVAVDWDWDDAKGEYTQHETAEGTCR